ncbi:hypothetical protein PMIN01_11772 [Paraphaeosphaeria minitans]|uniref:Chromo domain-containing protein n=1 Tax=Paraphaeosphaeria minitans TaxID=565426 RepID=A0A9P6G6N4_9PLEO|nr:hypothetical protein PMIN01_11772 [Paraphaeosphaeria minitans]
MSNYPKFDDILGIEPDSNSARGTGEQPAHAAHGVEVVDLTCSADNEANYENSDSGRESNFGSRLNRSHPLTNSRIDAVSDDETSDDGYHADGDDRSGVVERDDNCLLPHRERSVNYEQDEYAVEIPSGTLESANQDYAAERSSQEITSGIGDQQVHSMADSAEGKCRSQSEDARAQNTMCDPAQMSRKSEVIDLTDSDDESSNEEGEEEGAYRSQGARSSSVLQEAHNRTRPAASESPTISLTSSHIPAQDVVPHGHPLFVADTGISSSDQSLQTAGTHAIQDSMVEPRQSQRSEPASDQGEYSPLRGVSDGGDDNHYHNDGNGDDSRDQRMSSLRLVQKRKRDASVSSVDRKRHSRTSSKRSKQRLTNAAHAPKQRSRYLSHCPPQSTSKVLARAYAEVQCSEDTGAESSSDGAGNDENSKELQSIDDGTEYEVERILKSGLSRGNLKYQAQWVGYEADPRWYSASNFKNSPRKLREFHKANPTEPGPPKRLSYWERCYDEDRDAVDFPDDDKPGRTVRGGRRAVRRGRAAI